MVPNITLIIVGIEIGNANGTEAILWTTNGAIIAQVVMWLSISAAHARAVYIRNRKFAGQGKMRIMMIENRTVANDMKQNNHTGH